MASRKYYFVGSHADTLYLGDNAVPVGHGMEPILISDADFEDERNAHLKESFQAVSEAKEEVAETKAQVKEGGEK